MTPMTATKTRRYRDVASLILMTSNAALALAGTVPVGRFISADPAPPDPWRIQRFDERIPATRYTVREWDGEEAVEAHAEGSMALLARPLSIDLAATPYLCWRWRVDAPVKDADMTRKSGDDYAARVYITFQVDRSALGFGTRTRLALARSIYGDQVPDAALNYVWDNRNPVGTLRDNAYTDRARMFVLRSGTEEAGRWVTEQRNVAADFRRAFGDLPAKPTGLAIASDTDNTGGSAHAGFARFRFAANSADCAADGQAQPGGN